MPSKILSSILFHYLSLARLVIGVSAWILPEFTSKVFGMQKPTNPDSTLILRLFGSRDFVMGGALLYAKGNPEAVKIALQLGLVCDLVDVIAGLIAFKSGTGVKATVLAVGGAAVFSAIAVFLLSTGYSYATQ